MLIITASHQTFSGQFWCLSGQNKFDLTHLLYIINGKVSVFLEDKVMSGQISTLIISNVLEITGAYTGKAKVKRNNINESISIIRPHVFVLHIFNFFCNVRILS